MTEHGRQEVDRERSTDSTRGWASSRTAVSTSSSDGHRIRVYRQERYRDGSDSRRYRCLTLTPENASRLATALFAHAKKALDQRLPNQLRVGAQAG